MSGRYFVLNNTMHHLVHTHPKSVIAVADEYIIAVSPTAELLLCPSRSEEIVNTPIERWLGIDQSSVHSVEKSQATENSAKNIRVKIKNNGLFQSWINASQTIPSSDNEPTLIFLDITTSEHISPLRRGPTAQSEMTDRIKTQQALRESEERYRTVFEMAGIGIVISDATGHIIDSNPAIQTMLGYNAEELRGLNISDFAECTDCTSDLLGNGQSNVIGYKQHTEEIVLHSRDGQNVWCEVVSTGLHDSQGSLSFMLILVKDITEQRNSQEALKQSEEHYRFVVENAHDVIFSIDENDVFTFLGGAVEQMLGAKPRSLIGKTREQVANRYNLAAYVGQSEPRTCHEAYALGFDSMSYELTAGYGDDIRYFEIREQILRNEDGSFAGTSGSVFEITERYKHRKEIEKHKEEIIDIVDSIPAYVFFVDNDFRLLWANDSYTEAVGRPLDEITGLFLIDIHPNVKPDFSERFIAEHRLVCESGEAIRDSVQPCLEDRGIEFVQFDKVPFRNDAGGISGVLYVAVDVTARVKAEQRLRESEEQFRAVFDNAAIGIVVFDLNGCMRLCNKNFQGLVGYKADDLKGHTSSIITHPDDVHLSTDIFNSFNDADVSDFYQIEKRYVHKDGHIVWARVSATAVRNPRGEALHLIAIVEDITARKAAENSLAEAHVFTETVIARAGEGIVVLDKDFNVVAWNCFMEQLSGILCMDAMGRNMRELPPYTSDYHIDVDLNTVLEGDTIVIKDVPFTSRTDGSQKYATISYVPHRSVDNHIFGIIETVHDVTNRKLAVDKLLKTNEELHNAYLTQKAFLNNVTHEVRTPLTAVQGYCEMLIEGIFGPISEEQSDMINRILASSTQLMEIVNTILEMTRLSCGAPILRLKVCDPGMVLSQVLVTTTPLASRKSVALNIVDDSKDRLGMYDEQKLQVVLTNLMTNAIKFTDRGSIDVFVEIEQNSTTIIVADTGIGIKESQIETIFDEFRQLDFPGKHKPSGFGIGLSIVAAMVDVMGATLTVSSAQGVGTAFTLYLPVGDLASVTAQNAAANKS